MPDATAGLSGLGTTPRALAPFGRRACKVACNDTVGEYRLVGLLDGQGPTPAPGQFYMLAAARGWGGGEGERPYLARAFSVCRVRGGRLDFLVEAIGPGTARLAELEPEEDVHVVGPLGVGFAAPSALTGETETRALLVAGGAGVAPLVIWAEALRERDANAIALAGFRSSALAPAAELFPCDSRVATDDGSAGEQGQVTTLLEAELASAVTPIAVYACGPPLMLEAVRRICERASVPAQLALEQAMACGFGACFGCVVKTRTGYRRVCVDGPVMSAGELEEGWLKGH